MEAKSVPLCLLQTVHDNARFPAVVSPPCFMAITWSISCLRRLRSSETRQYSHWRLARETTSARSAALTSGIASMQDSKLLVPLCLSHRDQMFQELVPFPFVFFFRTQPDRAALFKQLPDPKL